MPALVFFFLGLVFFFLGDAGTSSPSELTIMSSPSSDSGSLSDSIAAFSAAFSSILPLINLTTSAREPCSFMSLKAVLGPTPLTGSR